MAAYPLKGTLKIGLFTQTLRYAKNFIPGISTICLRQNDSQASTLNKNPHFSRYPLENGIVKQQPS
jgi:hypothetical protein